MGPDKFIEVQKSISNVIMGKDDVIEKVMAAILAKGHILLEDIPGVGKTTLAVAFSKVLSLEYRRMQFTPDVLPADVTGFSMYNKQTNTFEYVKGAAICNLFLADEINRTSPKTQSALLEIMEEGKVTVDGVTRSVPEPFCVIATQNPLGSVGTQKLPESQLDRFMIKLSMGYPSHENEVDILKKESSDKIGKLVPIVTFEDIIEAQKDVENICVKDVIYEYIVDLVELSRKDQELELGLSPRGSIALLHMSRAYAYLNGRDYVIPEDVIKAFYDVSSHRVVLNARAKADGISVMEILQRIQTLIDIPDVKKL